MANFSYKRRVTDHLIIMSVAKVKSHWFVHGRSFEWTVNQCIKIIADWTGNKPNAKQCKYLRKLVDRELTWPVDR